MTMKTIKPNEIILLRAILNEFDDAKIIFKGKTFTATFKAKEISILKSFLQHRLQNIEKQICDEEN